MNCPVLVREEWKQNFKGFFKVFNVMDVIFHSNTNNFNPVAQFFIILNNPKNFVYNGSLPLTDSSATIEYFNDNNIRTDILYLEGSFI